MASPSQYRIWWINPGWAFTLMVVPFALATYFITDTEYQFSWRTSRFFEVEDLGYVIACTAAFLFGGAFSIKFSAGPKNDTWGKFSAREVDFLLLLFRFGAALTVVAYAIWTLIGIHNGVDLNLVKDGMTGRGGAVYETKAMMTTLPGITTAIQFEMAVFILGTILVFNGRALKVAPWLMLLFVLLVMRGLLNSERLAITEALTPTICLVAFYCRKRLVRYLRGVASVIWPAIGIVWLYLLFTASEYGRAWTTFYQSEGNYASLWEFSLMRLIGYYVTALNNGALIYDTLGQRVVPWATFQWLWKFPVIGGWLYWKLTSTPDISPLEVLSLKANPEFNNYSALYDYALDWGMAGAIILFFIVGMIVFNMYRRFVRGNATGLLLYPFIYIGILEAARTTYWTNSRTFPSWALLLLAVYGMYRIRNKQRLATQSKLSATTRYGEEPPATSPIPAKMTVLDPNAGKPQ